MKKLMMAGMAAGCFAVSGFSEVLPAAEASQATPAVVVMGLDPEDEDFSPFILGGGIVLNAEEEEEFSPFVLVL